MSAQVAEAFGQVPAPDAEVYRQAIESQTCPWCGKSGFKALAIHTAHVHEVSAADLRTLAGYGKKKPTCAPEVGEAQSRIQLLRGSPVHLHTPEVIAKRMATPRAMSEYGITVARALLAACSDDEQRRRAAKIGGPMAAAARRMMPIQHGRVAGYARGCRCAECRAANTLEHRDYMRARKAMGNAQRTS